MEGFITIFNANSRIWKWEYSNILISSSDFPRPRVFVSAMLGKYTRWIIFLVDRNLLFKQPVYNFCEELKKWSVIAVFTVLLFVYVNNKQCAAETADAF